jgi:phosphopantetheinyl transferase
MMQALIHWKQKAKEGTKDIDFNLSHHGDWVVIAACSNGEIGIDVTTRNIPSGSIQEFIDCFTFQVDIHSAYCVITD